MSVESVFWPLNKRHAAHDSALCHVTVPPALPSSPTRPRLCLTHPTVITPAFRRGTRAPVFVAGRGIASTPWLPATLSRTARTRRHTTGTLTTMTTKYKTEPAAAAPAMTPTWAGGGTRTTADQPGPPEQVVVVVPVLEVTLAAEGGEGRGGGGRDSGGLSDRGQARPA